MPARISKLTPERQKGIVKCLRKGMTRTLAIKAAGITQPTFYSWLTRGRKASSGRHHDFLRAVEKAEADCAKKQLDRIYNAADEPRHWTAAAWILERRFGYTKPPHVDPSDDETPQDEPSLPRAGTKAWREAILEELRSLPEGLLEEALEGE